jgi:hypothetical protein
MDILMLRHEDHFIEKMVFILIKVSLLGGKPSFPFDNHQQGGMGQN